MFEPEDAPGATGVLEWSAVCKVRGLESFRAAPAAPQSRAPWPFAGLNPERLGRLQVNEEFKLARLHDREIGRFAPLMMLPV
jgi:hypothetical protein